MTALSLYPYPVYISRKDPIQMSDSTDAPQVDMVNHPPHYTSDPSGVECITITRHRNFNIGNAIKYLWRAGLKDDFDRSTPLALDRLRSKQIEDLKKAVFYINDEIGRLEAQAQKVMDQR